MAFSNQTIIYSKPSTSIQDLSFCGIALMLYGINLQKTSLKQRSDEHLSKYSDQIYFVSAREGLLGKLQQDDSKWFKSNIPTVLKKMEHFLVQNQTNVKLESFWQQCMQMSTYTLFQLIPRMEHLLLSTEDAVKHIKSVYALEQTERERIDKSKRSRKHHISVTEDDGRKIDSLYRSFHLRFKKQRNLYLRTSDTRQEREDIIIDWFNQWLQQALHRSPKKITQAMEVSFQIKIQVDAVRMDHIMVFEALDSHADEIQLFQTLDRKSSLLITTALSNVA